MVARKVNVRAFPNDSVIIFDFDNMIIKKLDYNGDKFNQINIQENSKMDYLEMLQDTVTDNYF